MTMFTGCGKQLVNGTERANSKKVSTRRFSAFPQNPKRHRDQY